MIHRDRIEADAATVLQVKGVLDKEEVLFAKNKGYLYGTHVVVGLPQCLAEASKEPNAVAIMQHTLAVAVDEVDACFLVSLCTLADGSNASFVTATLLVNLLRLCLFL